MKTRHWFLLLLLASVRLSSAQGFGNPLTQDQVDCEERQMMRLLHRAVVNSDGSTLFLWRSAPGGDVYRGLSVGSEIDGDPYDSSTWYRKESQMPFDLILRESEDFPNPKRPRLPQATLVRRDAATNLGVLVSGGGALDAQLDLAPQSPNPTEPQGPLRITNQRSPGAGQADRGARSLSMDNLLGACHAEVSEFDLKVYSILARTMRPSFCLFQGRAGCLGPRLRYKIVLFRGTEPLTYRMNILNYANNCIDNDPCFYGEGRIALLFRLQVDGQGNLTGGDVQAYPWCLDDPSQLACNDLEIVDLALFVMPPMLPGGPQQGPEEFKRAAILNIAWPGSDLNVLHANINWIDLLKDTSWNGGLQPPKHKH
ncbi:MAG TPA: hypothetical protein VH988_22400 [Thermoanaerobaculia bacterium]|jgi:hypothetical protein|nr:hypothetical protein [Thermoanaerobaculia bacterium]